MPDAQARSQAPAVPRSVVVLFSVSLLAVVVAGVWAFVVSRPPRPYPAGTPEAMLDSAVQMVERREAGRLVELLEVAPPGDTVIDRERMGDLYLLLGRVLDRAQRLSDATAERFPREIERLRAAAERGEAPSLFGAMARSAAGRRGEPEFAFGFGADPARQERFNRALAALLADPYQKLAEGRARLSTTPIGDETEALLWDGRPIMPPVGLLVRRGDDGAWRLVPPTTLPGASRFLPATESEYAIWGSLLATIENVLKDLESDVRSGRVGSLEELSAAAVQKAVVPMGMVMVAYGQAVRDREREASP